MDGNLLLRKPALKWVNEYYEKKDYILLKIFRKNYSEIYNVLIDREDFNKVSQGQWYVSIARKNTHLKNVIHINWTKTVKGKKCTYDIYQWILDTKNKNIIIDHINMNRLDNRRKNLRISNPTENAINQVYRGYNYDKYSGKFLVRISIKGFKAVNIGRYNTEIEAETMYLKAMILLDTLKLSEYHKQRAKFLNVKITEEDYKNKYIRKIIKRFNIDENKFFHKKVA